MPRKKYDRDKTLDGASSLFEEISAVRKVEDRHRAALINDKLRQAVDSICADHIGGRDVGFNDKQVAILKEIAFHVYYVTDPRNRPCTGFWRRAWREFRDTDIAGKAATIAALIAIIGGLAAGAIFLWETLTAERSVLETSPPVKPNPFKPLPSETP